MDKPTPHIPHSDKVTTAQLYSTGATPSSASFLFQKRPCRATVGTVATHLRLLVCSLKSTIINGPAINKPSDYPKHFHIFISHCITAIIVGYYATFVGWFPIIVDYFPLKMVG